MLSLEERRAANLLFFLRDRWQADLHAIQAQSSEFVEAVDYNSVALLESFLWLFLGVQVDYFPKELSVQVVNECLDILLKAYGRAVQGKHDQKFFPLQKALEVQLSGRRELFAWPGRLPLLPSQSLSRVFQSSLILSNEFARDQAAYFLVQPLVFASAPFWQKVEEELQWVSLLPAAELEAHPEEVKAFRDRIFAGMVKVVNYMETYQSVSRDVERVARGLSQAAKSDLLFLKQTIYEIQQWRLNFRDNVVFERFLKVAGYFADALCKGVADGVVQFAPAQMAKVIAQRIRVSMVDWGAPAFSIEAGA